MANDNSIEARELDELFEQRAATYDFLARLFKKEADEDLLKAISQMTFPSKETGLFAEGASNLAAYVKRPRFNALQSLRVDYAKTFLAAGISEGGAAFPYESVYTSPERLIMQDARDEVVAFYRAHGLGKDPSWNDPEDHIALELEFMARLCEEGGMAAESGRWDDVSASVEAQREFLEKHLINWVPAFCRDVGRYASTDFYKGAALMTSGFVSLDSKFLEICLSGEG